MGVAKKIAGAAIALSTLFEPKSNAQIAMARPFFEPEKMEIKGIEKPAEPVLLRADIYLQKKHKDGLSDSLNIGELELRSNSLYANVGLGHYQFIFRQKNDSTFIEEVYTRGLFSFSERHEVFTTKRRRDANNNLYLVLEEYTTKIGSKREEKTPLQNKKFEPKFIPAIIALHDLLKNNLEKEVNLCVLGETYTFTIYDEKKVPLGPSASGKNETLESIKYAKMSEVTATKYNEFIMKDHVNIYSDVIKTYTSDGIETKLIPKKFEGQFMVKLKGLKSIFNGDYKGTGVIR